MQEYSQRISEPVVAINFIEALYGPGILPAKLLLWSPHTSYWCTHSRQEGLYEGVRSVEATIKELTKPEYTRDVYFGVCLSPDAMGPFKRCVAGRVSHAPGLWVDIDYAGAGHQKQLLPSKETVDRWLCAQEDDLIVVHTGNGVHVYLPFTEPFDLRTGTDREIFADAMQAFQAQVRLELGNLEGREVTLDATHDLARVLRLPGTTNWKDKEHPKPITAEYCRRGGRLDARKLLVEFLAPSMWGGAAVLEVPTGVGTAVPEEPAAPSEEASTVPEGAVEAASTVPGVPEPAHPCRSQVLEALQKNSVKFMRLWRRTPMQRTLGWSDSEYDLAIACHLAELQWTDDDILWALGEHRRIHGRPTKGAGDPGGKEFEAFRSKWRLTLEKARRHARGDLSVKMPTCRPDRDATPPEEQALEREEAAEREARIQEALAKASEATGTGTQEGGSEAAQDPKDTLLQLLGVYLHKITRMDLAPTQYAITLSRAKDTPEEDRRTIEGLKVNSLIVQTQFRAVLADGAAILPKLVGKKSWQQIAELLLTLVEHADIGTTHTIESAVSDVLESFLAENAAVDSWDAQTDGPVLDEIHGKACLTLRARGLLTHARTLGLPLLREQIGRGLTALGWVEIRPRAGSTRPRVWAQYDKHAVEQAKTGARWSPRTVS